MAHHSRLDRRRCTRLTFVFAFVLFILLWLNPNWTDTSVHHVYRFDASDADLANPVVAQGICRQHGWKSFKGAGDRKVYDLIMVNTELDWLEIRLNGTY